MQENYVLDDNILALSKLKRFADDKTLNLPFIG